MISLGPGKHERRQSDVSGMVEDLEDMVENLIVSRMESEETWCAQSGRESKEPFIQRWTGIFIDAKQQRELTPIRNERSRTIAASPR